MKKIVGTLRMPCLTSQFVEPFAEGEVLSPEQPAGFRQIYRGAEREEERALRTAAMPRYKQLYFTAASWSTAPLWQSGALGRMSISPGHEPEGSGWLAFLTPSPIECIVQAGSFSTHFSLNNF